MIILAVADQLKLKIIIAETHEQFGQYSVVQAVTSTQQLTDVYLGHIDEYHYVSTLPCSGLNQIELTSENSVHSTKSEQMKRKYMKEYMRQKRACDSLQLSTQSPAS